MIFKIPRLDPQERYVVEQIDDLRQELSSFLFEPKRWMGSLRRATLARAVRGSNSIEGYDASLEDVAAAMEGEEPLDASEETRQAIVGYRDAMTYVLALAEETERPSIDVSLLRSLHYMMMKYDITKHPGRWRPGWIGVEDSDTTEIVYEAPDVELVPSLIDELLEQVNGGGDEGHHPMILGAMAHLNLVMIHPFSDGNGRMARCLQTFVLAGEGVVSPVFSSIEEYLGRNTESYYDVLADVGQGNWNPDGDVEPWIRFCLTAHYRQAVTLLRRIRETDELWAVCDQLVREHGVPDRSVAALADAATGFRIRRSSYLRLVDMTTGEGISELTGTRDLGLLVEKGLLVPHGQRRGRYYTGSDQLRSVWSDIRARRPRRGAMDPFDQAFTAQEPLPFEEDTEESA